MIIIYKVLRGFDVFTYIEIIGNKKKLLILFRLMF